VSLLQPDSPEAAANLGSSYKDAARHDAAIGAYRRALALRPDFPEAFANLVHSLQCVCEWAERPALFARLEGEVRRDLAAGRLPAVQPFHAMAYPFSADLALAISRAYAEQAALAAARLGLPPLPHPAPLPLGPGRRLRVGYVSSDFGNHPLSHLMGSVFGLHDRRRVEVFCYGAGGLTRRLWGAGVLGWAASYCAPALAPGPGGQQHSGGGALANFA
jgi:protein O-GlcNAc transferase